MSTESKIRYALYVLLAAFVTSIANILAYLTAPQKVIAAIASHGSASIAIEMLMLVFAFGPMCFYAADKIAGKPLIGITVGDDKEKS